MGHEMKQEAAMAGSTKPWKRPENGGFTFVELMVVVGIMAILIAIAAYNFAGWASRSKVEAFTRDLQSSLMDARMSAIQTSTTHCMILGSQDAAQPELYVSYTVNRDTNNNYLCTGTGADAGGAQTISGFPKNVIFGTTNPASDIRLNDLMLKVGGVVVDEVDFSPRGMLVDANGTMIPSTIIKVDYPGECYFTGECADPLTQRIVFPDIDCVVLTPTQVSVGHGRIDPATNLWDGADGVDGHCDVK